MTALANTYVLYLHLFLQLITLMRSYSKQNKAYLAGPRIHTPSLFKPFVIMVGQFEQLQCQANLLNFEDNNFTRNKRLRSTML